MKKSDFEPFYPKSRFSKRYGPYRLESPKEWEENRFCLRCNIKFLSKHNENRLCHGCIALINEKDSYLTVEDMECPMPLKKNY